MIDGLKPYSKYKDSGVPWLGEVPEHWGITKLNRIISSSNAGEVIDRGWWGEGREILYTCARTPILSDFHDFPPNKRATGKDLLLTRNGTPYVHRPPKGAIYSNVVQRIILSPEFRRDWVALALETVTRGMKGYGVSIESLNFDMWKVLPILLPSHTEQTAIVRFLDWAERRIRQVIRAREKRIKLLEEYKQALIHQAVTKYKDSGVEWLGEVPVHWKVTRLKHWVGVNKNVLPDSTPPNYEFWYLDIGSVGTGSLLNQPLRLCFGDAPSRARRIVRRGDTIMSTVRTYLKAVYFIEDEVEDVVASTGFAVLTPLQETKPKFVSYLVQGDSFTNCVTAESIGIAYPAIAETRLASFHVAVPPLPEQTAIVEFLDEQTERIDAAITADRRVIELLKEFRTRLIADVVTGKLDVRETAAKLPEEEAAEDVEPESEIDLETVSEETLS